MTGARKRQPWLKWYPSDWRAEPRLKMVSRAARSLWIDMIGLMHEAEPYGCLIIAGKPLENAAEIACILGDKEREIRKLLSELERAKVFSRVGQEDLPDDIAAILPSDLSATTILSRKMVRDNAKAEKNRANGKLGGNPELSQTDNPTDNRSVKAQRPEARSQSSVLRTDAEASDPKKKALEEKPQTTSKPVANCKDWLWRDGLNWLSTATGRKEPPLRSLLGRWLKDTKENPALLREIFEAAQDQAAVEPISWIKAAITNRINATAPFEQTDEHGWRKRFESYRKNGTWPEKWGGKHPGDDPRHPHRLLKEFGFRKAA